MFINKSWEVTKYECFVTLLKCFLFFFSGIWNIALVIVIKSVKMYGFTSGFFPLVQTDVLQNPAVKELNLYFSDFYHSFSLYKYLHFYY